MKLTLPARVIATNIDPPQVRLRVVSQGRKVEWDLPVVALSEEWQIGREWEIEVREKGKP